jgi:hypothetical protein
MPVLNANPGRFSWLNPDSTSGSFTPRGRLQFHGSRNPITKKFPEVYAARLIVGLSIGIEPGQGMDDIIRIVKQVRAKQVGNPSASFVAQRGMYQYLSEGKKVVVEEDGVQVIVINEPEHGVNSEDFEAQMVELAEELARELQQEVIIMEMQRNGVSQFTAWVTS